MKHRGVFKPISMARRSIDHANDHANVLDGVLEKIGRFFVTNALLPYLESTTIMVIE